MKINFIPLTFIKSQEDLNFQIRNTLIMKKILEKFSDEKELKELLKKTQYGFTTSAKKEGRYKFLRITDLKNGKVDWENVPSCDGDCNNYLLKGGDIVIARTGNNKSFLIKDVPNNAIFASYLIKLEVNRKVLLPEYLYMFLNSYLFWSQVLKMQTGTTLSNVNGEKLKKLRIPYCPIKEQERIVKGNFDKNLKEVIKKVEDFLISKEKLALNSQKDHELLKKLKQSILQEAVQGKLVPQDPKDEPASELLKKIKREKEKLIKEGKIKKQKPLPQIEEDEIPYKLPKGWVWVRLGDITEVYTGNSISKSIKETKYTNLPEGYNYISTKDVKFNGLVNYETGVKIPFNEKKFKIAKSNSTLICIEGGSAGKKIAKINEDVCFGNKLCSISSIVTNCDYTLFYINSPVFKSFFFVKMNGIIGGVGVNKIKSLLFPLPPLAEQKRIVAKVDELMKYCDKLEEKIKQNKEYSEKLMGAVLRESFEK